MKKMNRDNNRKGVGRSSSSASSLPLTATELRKRSMAQGLHYYAQHKVSLLVLGGMTIAWTGFVFTRSHLHLAQVKPSEEHAREQLLLPFMKHKEWVEHDILKRPEEVPNYFAEWTLPAAFVPVLERAKHNQNACTNLQSEEEFAGFDQSFHVPFGDNETVASLPSFGIIEELEKFQTDPVSLLGGLDDAEMNAADWRCVLPPETECHETKFSVIFMAYNPDRLDKTFRQIKKMVLGADWKTLVKEVILVWNGPRSVDESEVGQALLQFAATEALRVVYPLRMGLENDLLNRYHPKVVRVTTKAILYYDDDGPFYSFDAVQGGFELWKRHSSSQIGAMARELTYGERQRKEHAQLLAGQHANDSQFVSHCTNVQDKVDYNYRYFANYDANMVLPSGSLLHSNYLCFLWHPVLEPIRDFVRKHPVNPDDVTVSMVVSQLAGKAPRVYSRKLPRDDGNSNSNSNSNNKGSNRRNGRRLLFESPEHHDTTSHHPPLHNSNSSNNNNTAATLTHRRLMFGINWDAKGGMDAKKHYWAALRTEAINALVQYFGSLNSGSIGWCDEGSPYYNEKIDGRCQPAMARIGWLPWMNPDGTPLQHCP